MATIKSLDPRVARAELPVEPTEVVLNPQEQWETYEVFHQKKSGARHTHQGTVHAPSPELAYAFAKEQYGRRDQTYSIWVVRTAQIFTLENDNTLYKTVPEKEYRNAGFYKVRDKIERFKREMNEH